MERRKEVRLSLNNATLVVNENTYILENLSYSGIKLKGKFNIDQKISGVLYVQEFSTPIDLIVKNIVNDSAGCAILNPELVKSFLEPWFNPRTLMSKLKPEKSNDGLFYEDQTHNCWFKFYFSNDKQINKISIVIHNNEVVWNNNNWTTHSLGIEDKILDQHKISLVKDMIGKTTAFPQSFKDWLSDLF